MYMRSIYASLLPEGTFKGVVNHLRRLKIMGVDILPGSCPLHPLVKQTAREHWEVIMQCADYKAINPEYGNMDDFKLLVEVAQANGFKVIIDWVANHTGADHPWLTQHPDFYNRDSTGKAVFVYDWTDTRDLNFDNKEMRDSMIAAMKYWLKETNRMVFRCDVAGEVPDRFLERLHPATAPGEECIYVGRRR